jgi:hypothetical protein
MQPLVTRVLTQTRARLLGGDTHVPDKVLSVFRTGNVTREDAQSLLDELNALDIRWAAVTLRRPGHADVAQLRHDIAARRADVIDALAWLRQADASESSSATLQ